MTPELKALQDLAKACTIRRLAASGPVSAKPCFVSIISVCPTDATLVYAAEIHNGETSSAEVLFEVSAQFGQTKLQPTHCMYFNKGIYVALTTNIKSVTIQFMEEGR